LWLLNGVERPREPHTPYRKLPVHDSQEFFAIEKKNVEKEEREKKLKNKIVKYV